MLLLYFSVIKPIMWILTVRFPVYGICICSFPQGSFNGTVAQGCTHAPHIIPGIGKCTLHQPHILLGLLIWSHQTPVCWYLFDLSCNAFCTDTHCPRSKQCVCNFPTQAYKHTQHPSVHIAISWHSYLTFCNLHSSPPRVMILMTNFPHD